VAVAINREPELLRTKVKALYFNVGNGQTPLQNEYNVGLDPNAYVRLFHSGPPLYWCPCFGKEGYATFFVADQSKVVGPCTDAVQKFFAYCLSRAKADPIAFLAGASHPLPQGKRNMWCTGPMLHAAGLKIYQRGADDFVALAPEKAKRAGLETSEVRTFEFVPVHARAAIQQNNGKAEVHLVMRAQPEEPNAFVFRSTDPKFAAVLASCLKNLLADLGR